MAAQAAEPVAVAPVDLVQFRSPHFLVQPLPPVLVAARLRLVEVALLAAVAKVAEVAAVDVAVVAASVVAVVLPLPLLQ